MEGVTNYIGPMGLSKDIWECLSNGVTWYDCCIEKELKSRKVGKQQDQLGGPDYEPEPLAGYSFYLTKCARLWGKPGLRGENEISFGGCNVIIIKGYMW